MGSIISFPFLCIANAALCRMAMEHDQGKVGRICLDSNIQLRVNGDDCTLIGKVRSDWHSGLFFWWREISYVAGLKSSPGKTYHSQFSVINSRRYNWNKEWHQWEEEKFVNMGLLKGMKRSSAGRNDGVWVGEMGALHRELYEQTPREIWGRVHESFIYFNAKTLKQFKGSWYAPEFLGGLGLVGELSEHDNYVCSTIRRYYTEYAPRAFSQSRDWMMHDRVIQDTGKLIEQPFIECVCENYKVKGCELEDEEEFLSFPFTEFDRVIKKQTYDIKENYSDIYNMITIQTLFKSNLREIKKSTKIGDKKKDKELAKKLQLDERQHKKRIEKTNSRIWQHATKHVDKNLRLLNYLDLRPMNKKVVPVILKKTREV
jgi:hypothetical protein